ncbi:MAG: hypothetical protein ACREN2_07165 [Candidatus Dormibacteria bacterium]
MGETTNGGTTNDGGPGWGIREPQPPPSAKSRPIEPLSTAPPASPPTASPAPAERPPWEQPPQRLPRLSRSAVFAVIGAVALFTVAGGGALLLSGSHAGPPVATSGGAHAQSGGNPASLTSAVTRVEGSTMRADISFTQSFTATGPGGVDFGAWPGGEIVVNIHIDQQSATRSELRETVQALGVNETMLAVLYDDTVYVSTNNGASYQTATIDRANTAEVSPQSPLAFLQMLGDVKSNGDVEVNGATASSYHAALDPVKLGNYLKNELAQENDPDMNRVLNNLGVTDASLDAAVDGHGNLISESGNIDAAIDLGAFSPADAGTTLNMHEGMTGAFSGYGDSIDITKPGVVTGPATI